MVPVHFKIGSENAAMLQLAPDGQHVLARWRKDNSIRSCIDGQDLPSAVWKKGHKPECFEAEALNRLGWLERSGRRVSVVVSDLEHEERHGPFDDVKKAFFSDDGRHLVFAFARDENWWVWFDGRELGPFSSVEYPELFGSKLMFEARRGRRHFVWIDGHELGGHQNVFWPSVAPDGSVAFGFKKGAQYFIQIGSVVFGPYPAKPHFQIGRSSRIAVQYEVEGTTRVELDQELVWEFPGHVVTLKGCFSPDAKRFGFAYQERNFAGFYLDGARHGELGYADGPWWSPDGQHVAWGADGEPGLIQIDGREVEVPTRIDFEEGSSFRFAPDGRFCFVLKDGTGMQLLRIGEQQFGPFYIHGSARRSQFEKVAFSDGGAHFAFLYGTEAGSFVQRNDETFGPFESCEFSLGSDGTLYIATLDPRSLEVQLEQHAATS